MHLLDNDQAEDRLRRADPTWEYSVPDISTHGRFDQPTMDHLDALEAQSIYIFREAFARLKKLALLWSLGKDSNVMIWLARKAFFGRVPFPALHVDTGKKFPEMYAFRDRYGKEWELDLKVEPCPPLETIDPTLPPAARSAARKTEGLKARARQIWLRWIDRRHSPRRRGHPRQGAGVLAARHRRRMGRARSAAGILGPVQRFAAARRAFAHSPDPALDRGRHLGLHAARKYPDHSALSGEGRQALSFAGRSGHHQSRGFDRFEHRGNPDRARRHQGAGARRAARSITKPKMPSSGCVSPAISEPTLS